MKLRDDVPPSGIIFAGRCVRFGQNNAPRTENVDRNSRQTGLEYLSIFNLSHTASHFIPFRKKGERVEKGKKKRKQNSLSVSRSMDSFLFFFTRRTYPHGIGATLLLRAGKCLVLSDTFHPPSQEDGAGVARRGRTGIETAANRSLTEIPSLGVSRLRRAFKATAHKFRDGRGPCGFPIGATLIRWFLKRYGVSASGRWAGTTGVPPRGCKTIGDKSMRAPRCTVYAPFYAGNAADRQAGRLSER